MPSRMHDHHLLQDIDVAMSCCIENVVAAVLLVKLLSLTCQVVTSFVIRVTAFDVGLVRLGP